MKSPASDTGLASTGKRAQLPPSWAQLPLHEVEFVVVDVETTGTNAKTDALTEIGAARIRGGKIIGEFSTLVNPYRPIPARIQTLTGITDRMVGQAPSDTAAIREFLRFSRGAILVAHNARFDISFLKAAAARANQSWPTLPVIDTLSLARHVYDRTEVLNHKLSTLAAHVGAEIKPDHRALTDVLATVAVFHALLERVGNEGISTLGDLCAPLRSASAVQIAKRHLANNVPAAPGIYIFEDAKGEALYVGTSRNLRARVRSYFTGAETRRRVLDILPRMEKISTQLTPTAIGAQCLELRTIAQRQPLANRQSLRPEKGLWLQLGHGTGGLKAVRKPSPEDHGYIHLGPLTSRQHVEPLRLLLLESVSGRETAWELLRSSRARTSQLEPYRDRLRQCLSDTPAIVLEYVAERIKMASVEARYEEAALIRDRALIFLRAAERSFYLRALAATPELFAVSPRENAYEAVHVSFGRLIHSTRLKTIEEINLFADEVRTNPQFEANFELLPPAQPNMLCFGYHQEAEILLNWLRRPETFVLNTPQWLSMESPFSATKLKMAVGNASINNEI